MNGCVLARSDEVAGLLDERRKNVPFVAELFASNGFKLALGIGSGIGFVQHRRINGDLPYYMARPQQRRTKSRGARFLVDNVQVPVPGRFVLNFDEVAHIVQHFLVAGERSTAFAWESI